MTTDDTRGRLSATAANAAAPADDAQPGPGKGRIDIRGLTASYAGRPAVTDVDISLQPGKVTAFIGPSGCGKTTVLRCINGLHLTVPKASVDGLVQFDGANIYDRNVDLVEVRRKIGMVFQRPTPFPTMSIADNVTAGLKFGPRGGRRTADLKEVAERSLRQAGLWDEVKDRLHKPGAGLSGGQQQRLCIARSLAVQPQALLMDEPCSALDPISTMVIEDLITDLKRDYTIVIVTHNMQQAARVSDVTAFFTVPGPGQPGHLVEAGPTASLFEDPAEQATQDYISGKVG